MSRESPTTPSKLDKAIFLSSKIKADVSQVFRRSNNDDHDSLSSQSDTASALFEDAAFNPQMVLDGSPQEPKSVRSRLHRTVHGAAVMLKNPRRAMRSKYTRTVAGNLSGEPVRYDTKYDEELVKAHDALAAAQAHSSSWRDPLSDPTDDDNAVSKFDKECRTSAGDDDLKDEKARIQEIEGLKNSLRAAWILGRHVRRAKVVRPMERPPRQVDHMQSIDGRSARLRWDRYLAHLMLWYARGFTAHQIDDFDELPFDLGDLSRAAERLAIVSTPWQSFVVEVRDVYLWKDPGHTFTIMAAYWILWYFQHIVTAAFVWIIFATIRNKIRPTRVDTIRNRVRRAQDEQSKVQAWSELIQRHGPHDWVEPLLDELGPMIQMELGDLSSLLEIMQNFYRWERPQKTIGTLFFFVICLLISCVADMSFCVKLAWAALGCTFFFILPLSSKYPRYRKLFNPIYWIFWDVPNLAELSIIQLQEKVALKDAKEFEKVVEREAGNGGPGEQDLDSDPSDTSESEPSVTSAHAYPTGKHDIANDNRIPRNERVVFRAVNPVSHRNGRLEILRHGFWYHDKKIESFYQYTRLVEIAKVDVDQVNGLDTSKYVRLAKRINKNTTMHFLPSALRFSFLPRFEESTDRNGTAGHHQSVETQEHEQLILTLSESDRDKIFNLVIAWSKLRWQPMFSINTRNRLSPASDHPSKKGKGNQHLDDAIKNVVE